MEKPLKMSSRSSRNVLKLSKPAPRKNVTSETSVEQKENELTCAGDCPTKQNVIQENLVESSDQNDKINKRSSRNLKVDKPAPLKSSTPRVTGDKREPTSKLLMRSISDVVNQSQRRRHDSVDSNHYTSQMSQDSGVGDMLSCSRQSSILRSLSESPRGNDDIDWDDLVESPTDFALGREQMQCTAHAVNQAVPYNSIVTDIHSVSDANSNKRPRTPTNFSHKGNKKYTPKEKVQQSTVEDWDGDSLETKHGYKRPGVNKPINTEGSYSALKRSQQGVYSNFDIPKSVIYKKYDNNITSDSWDSDLLEIPGRAEGLDHTVEESNDAISLDTYSSLSNKCDDSSNCDIVLDKSGKILKSCDVPKIHGSALPNGVLASASKQKHVDIEPSSRHDTVYDENDNIKTENANILCGESIKSERKIEIENTRNVLETLSKGFAKNVVRLSPQDEGFNEEELVWESIDDDLAIGVQPIIIDDSLTEEDLVLNDCLPPQFSVEQFSILPDNFAEIEAELEGLSAEMDQQDKARSDSSTPIKSFTESLKNDTSFSVVKLREPLSPYSTMEEIWSVEEGLPWGMYTAKGRRQMFKTFKLCLNEVGEEEKESVSERPSTPVIVEPKRVIKYNADELLQIGTSPMSRKVPDAWSYLSVIFPDICLNHVMKYFDVESYKHERSYVVAVSSKYLCADKNLKKNGQNKEGQSNIQGGRTSKFLEVPPRQGFKAPPQRSTSQPTGTSEKTWLRRSNENINSLGNSSEKPWRRSNENIDSLGKSSENPWRRSNENINTLGSFNSSQNPLRRSNESLHSLDSSQKNWRKSNENINVRSGYHSDGSRENLNLDSKCDIHVNKRVLKQLVTDNVDRNESKASSMSYNRSISEPKGSKFSYGTTESCQNTRFAPRRCIDGNTSDLVMKPDLPKNCPW